MITSPELKTKLDGGEIHLIDVRLADDHAAEHIAGAANNCVYEVAFLSRMEDLCSDKSAPVCVYGACPSSHESRMATEKLTRAGYNHVSNLQEGIEGWKIAGFETTAGTPVSETPVLDGTLQVDLDESRVEWLGRNLINKHWGTIGIKSGQLTFDEGRLSSGEFILDMKDMKCTDLQDTDLHDVLINHLQNDDFFDTERYPEARLVIDSAEEIEGSCIGKPNLRLHAQLTLCGVTQKIMFNTTAGVTDTGKAAAQSAFSIDRTSWNIIYGSGRFFKRLAGHLVNDLIDLQIRVITA